MSRQAIWIVAAGAVLVGGLSTGGLGRGALLAAPLAALVVLLGVLAGELQGTARGPRRVATLEVRRTRDYLPRSLTAAVVLATGVLGLLLLATTLGGSADDLGRSGRALTRACGAGMTETHGPWAGTFYSAPLAAVVLMGLGAAFLVLRRVVLRPLVLSPDDPEGLGDEDRRRGSGRRVTAACGVMVTLPLTGLLVVTSSALLATTCRPTWWTVAGWAALVAVPVACAGLLACVAALAVPGRRQP